jgi:probable addiction module antidote protein
MEQDTNPSDRAGLFGSEDEIVDYINSWMADGSPREIARALSDVARSRDITEISLPGGAGPRELYPVFFCDGNPTLEMVAAVIDAMGLQLTVRKRAA